MPTDSFLQRQFGARLVTVARNYRRQLDRGLAQLALSHASGLAVMVLGRLGDGVRQGALADELGIEPPSIVPLVDQMERAGLVERRIDPSDKRARTLHLTDAGRALAQTAEERSREIREELFAGTDPKELEIALRVLDRLQDALEPNGQD